MAQCNDCHKLVRGRLLAYMESEPAISADASCGGGLLVVDVGIRLNCETDGSLLAYRCMELEELFDHSCRPTRFKLRDGRVRPTDQMIQRRDKRSSRRWLGADVTVLLECPLCQEQIPVAVTVGDYALEFLTTA